MSLKKERRSMLYYEFYKLLEHLRNTYIPVTSFLSMPTYIPTYVYLEQ